MSALRADIDAQPAEGGADVKRASEAAPRHAVRARLTSAAPGATRLRPTAAARPDRDPGGSRCMITDELRISRVLTLCYICIVNKGKD